MRRTIIISAFSALIGVTSAFAESHLLQDEFTFRRVGVPQAGARSRINVQIAPTEPSTPSSPASAGAAPTPGGPAIAGLAPAQRSGVEWYWEEISPSLDQAHEVSLERAVAALRAAPDGQEIPSPRLQGMAELANRYGVEILSATIGKDVSPALVLAVISVESAGRSDAVSSAGAQGLMQLMPPTAARFGVENAFDPSENINGGTAYLDWFVPPYRETRAYVPKVLAAWEVARGLCITPPELVTDGCVFSVPSQ